MTEREFWITVRAALIMFIKAIEKRYALGEYAPSGDYDMLEDKQHVVK